MRTSSKQAACRSRVLLGFPHKNTVKLPSTLGDIFVQAARVIAALRGWSKVDVKLLAMPRPTQPAACYFGRFGLTRETPFVLEQVERMAAINGQVAGHGGVGYHTQATSHANLTTA